MSDFRNELHHSRSIKETLAYLQQLSWVAYWSMPWDAAAMSLHKKNKTKDKPVTSVWNVRLGPVYTKPQSKLCGNSAMTLAILFSLKTTGSLENGLQSNSGMTPLFSMTAVSLASSQSCCSIDSDARYKRTIML